MGGLSIIISLLVEAFDILLPHAFAEGYIEILESE